MTPNQITTLIATNFDRELDMPFRLQLMERVNVWRSRLISNSLQKEPGQRKFFRQTLYMTMESTVNVPCAELVACPVARTVEEVPKLVRFGSMLFDYVGSIDGEGPFTEVAPGTGAYLRENRFAKMFPQYEFSNQRIITTKADLPMVRVDGVFDDPMAIVAHNCASGQSVNCDTWDMEYPCPNDILQLVIQSILQIDYNRPEREPSEEVQS